MKRGRSASNGRPARLTGLAASALGAVLLAPTVIGPGNTGAAPIDNHIAWRESWSGERPGAARAEHTAATMGGDLVVFGGYRTSESGIEVLGDLATYSFDSDRWSSPAVVNPGQAPSARYGHTAVVETDTGRMIVFGGRGRAGELDNSGYVLEMSGGEAVWTRLESPPELKGRWDHSAVYSVMRDSMLIYGGRTDDAVLDDTWELELGDAAQWRRVQPAEGPRPGALFGHVASLPFPDTRGGAPPHRWMLVHGGHDGCGTNASLWGLLVPNRGDAWRWTRLEAPGGPGGRYNHAAAPQGDDTYFFGWANEGGALAPTDGTWVLAPELSRTGGLAWHFKPTADGPPSPRQGTTLVWSAHCPLVCMFALYGGQSIQQTLSDTWSYARPDPPVPPEWPTPSLTVTPERTPAFEATPARLCSQPTVTPTATQSPEVGVTPANTTTPSVQAGGVYLPLASREW